jgi:SAM-dependent methyltransferase
MLLIPVFGYLLEWLVSFFSLPRILRHQRATDAYHSAREHELVEQCRSMAQQIEVIFIELGKLGSESPEISAKLKQLFDRLGPLSNDFERISSESTELRHMVLSMNHWLSSLRRSLSTLELAEAEQERRSDAFYANVSARVLESDPHRSARLAQWSGRLAAQLPRSAQVLDLCSGEDWLSHLRDNGLKPTGVDTNSEIAQRARQQGHAIIVAEPVSVLARTADHSLHGLTALDVGCLLRGMPTTRLLDEARRVLRGKAWVLFGFCGEPATIADRLDGRPEAVVDSTLIAQALWAAGFSDVEQVQAADGTSCVLAREGSQA